MIAGYLPHPQMQSYHQQQVVPAHIPINHQSPQHQSPQHQIPQQQHHNYISPSHQIPGQPQMIQTNGIQHQQQHLQQPHLPQPHIQQPHLQQPQLQQPHISAFQPVQPMSHQTFPVHQIPKQLNQQQIPQQLQDFPK